MSSNLKLREGAEMTSLLDELPVPLFGFQFISTGYLRFVRFHVFSRPPVTPLTNSPRENINRIFFTNFFWEFLSFID